MNELSNLQRLKQLSFEVLDILEITALELFEGFKKPVCLRKVKWAKNDGYWIEVSMPSKISECQYNQ